MGLGALYGIVLTREQLEQRRLAAAADLAAGMRQADVVRKYGVSRPTVSLWARKLRTGGTEALRRRKPRGAEPKLTPEQFAQLPGILLRGAPAYGWSTDLWTTERVAEVIETLFGVRYHRNHVGKVLRRRLRFTWQKPARRAREKDEARKRTWLRTTWPSLKKNSGRGGRSSSSTRAGTPRRRSSRGRGRPSGRRRSSSTPGTGRS